MKNSSILLSSISCLVWNHVINLLIFSQFRSKSVLILMSLCSNVLIVTTNPKESFWRVQGSIYLTLTPNLNCGAINVGFFKVVIIFISLLADLEAYSASIFLCLCNITKCMNRILHDKGPCMLPQKMVSLESLYNLIHLFPFILCVHENVIPESLSSSISLEWNCSIAN